MDYRGELINHYEQIWGCKAQIKRWYKGPYLDLSKDFCVLEFSPSTKHNMWIYATCCMSESSQTNPIELHLFSSTRSEELIEILTAMAHYHKSVSPLGLNHTVNFGKPWQNSSNCEYGYISLPYLDGPNLENFHLSGSNAVVKSYWVIPVTQEEVAFLKKNGPELLEKKFELHSFKYLDIHRNSVV